MAALSPKRRAVGAFGLSRRELVGEGGLFQYLPAPCGEAGERLRLHFYGTFTALLPSDPCHFHETDTSLAQLGVKHTLTGRSFALRSKRTAAVTVSPAASVPLFMAG
jgi:hypothetical protein